MPRPDRLPAADRLPAFPWDSLGEARSRAEAHPGGIVDLSVGTPVDPVDDGIRDALHAASAEPGYPKTVGTDELRDAIRRAMTRRHGAIGLSDDRILPVVGTKEAIAWLPFMLGVGPGHVVVQPELAYPTYEVGARFAGAEVTRADGLAQLGPATPSLIVVNSPSNPSGRVLGVDHMRKMVEWARERDVILASDECYLGLAWDAEAVSVLDPRVCDGDPTNLLAIHSLSKTSNMASYRAGWVAGDERLIAELTAGRRQAGLMMPGPIQAAMVRGLDDDAQEAGQRERYARRRGVLRAAVEAAGFTVDHSDGGLYLWATRGEPCRETVAWFAGRGILVAPGEFYGPAGARHVRIALTATDERIAAAAERLRGPGE